MLQAVGDTRTGGAYSERRISSIREKEQRQDAAGVNTVGTVVIISNSEPNEQASTEKSVNDTEKAAHTSSIELQTYKSLAPLLPAEEGRVEETPPASIFVIEADVNQATSDHFHFALRLPSSDEESRDRIDVAVG